MKTKTRRKPVSNAKRRSNTTRRVNATSHHRRRRTNRGQLHSAPSRAVVVYQGAHAMRRRRNRTHNPALKDILTTSVAVAGGVILTDVMVNVAGNLLPAALLGGPWGAIVLRFGAAWVLGLVGERFFSRATGNLMAAGGAAGAIQDLSRVALGTIGGVLAPPQPVVLPQGAAAPLQLPPGQVADLVRARRGLNDIVYGPGTQSWYQG